MDPRFIPCNERQALAHLLEELGELTAAAGKTLRWGELSYNPDLPEEARETNLAWMRREYEDVRQAYEMYMTFLRDRLG